jgi:predicted glutamine amidotransferase
MSSVPDRMTPQNTCRGAAGAVMVASEPITRRPEDWTTVPENHTLTVDSGLRVRVDPIVI